MKKIIGFLFIVILVFACYYLLSNYKEPKEESNLKDNSEVRGVFVSYIDYGNLLGKTKKEQENIINEMINNIYYFGFNSIILQVRSFSDAIYESDIYESSHVVVFEEGDPLNFDILDYFIKQAKKKGIEIYAWVNPYRIRNDNDISGISRDSYYYDWLDSDNVEITDKGIYLNPASSEVLEYITLGLKELCNNYDIKGVIYDDYYYPDDTIDLKTYKNSNSKLSIKEYRINNINKLLEESYKTIKSVNNNLKFGISPAGNIENNYDREYLDVENVLKSDYVDFVIPQLYYGFNNSSKPYIRTLDDWVKLNVKNKDLYVALSLYKSGKVDLYAGDGENEWLEEDDIIRKQILISRNKKSYNGFYIFRYEYLFKIYENDNLNKEVENLKLLLDNET